METLRTAVLSICAAAVTGSALYLLCPDGQMKRVCRAAIAAFFLCAVVSTVADTDFRAALTETEAVLSGFGVTRGEDLADAFTQQVVSQLEERLERQIGDTLTRAGIVPEDIFVRAHCTEDGCIELQQITLRMEPSERLKEAETVLLTERAVGVRPEVYYAD